jgi:anti-repressor protein
MIELVNQEEKLKATISLSGQNREMWFVTESGLYEILMQSRKPIAKQFKDKVKEILIEIRKTGSYIEQTEGANLKAIDKVFQNATPELLSIIATMANKQAELIADNERKAQQLEEQAPKVEFMDKMLKSKDVIGIGEFAKILCDEGFNIGEKRLFKYLRENMFLMSNNEPFQRYIDAGYFQIKENSIDTPFGTKLTKTTKLTPSGQIYLYKKIKDSYVNI